MRIKTQDITLMGNNNGNGKSLESLAVSIGMIRMILLELYGANLTENVARLIVNDASQLHPRFLMYWLASHHCQTEITAQTVKNAQPKPALARIKSLKVPLPSFVEQVEIASKLNLAGRKTDSARLNARSVPSPLPPPP